MEEGGEEQIIFRISTLNNLKISEKLLNIFSKLPFCSPVILINSSFLKKAQVSSYIHIKNTKQINHERKKNFI